MTEALSTEAFLDRLESEWIGDIRTASIAAEVIASPSFDPNHVRNALTGLGRIARKYSDARAMARWPAAVVISMSYKALEDYHQGAFWERFAESVPEHRGAWTTEDNSLWGDAYLLSIDKLRLPTFETSRKYVGNIVTHAGIPAYCYSDFLRVLGRGINQVGFDGPAVVSWLRARVDTSTYLDIDAPVRDFISAGDIYAADFVARNVELLDRLQHDEDTAGVGLSTRYVDLATDYAGGTGIPLSPPSHTRQRRRPMLRFDFAADRLVVDLPPVDDGQGMAWSISADGEHHEVRPNTAWATTHGAAAAMWDVPTPCRRLTIGTSVDTNMVFTVDLIADGTPYLLFQEDGTHISAESPVRNEPTWILRLDDGSEVSGDGAVHTVAQGSFPLGWSDWKFELIDLSGATSFRVGTSTSRRLSIRSRARVVCEDAVPSVTSAGLPVYASRPRIELPDDIPFRTWSVSIKDLRDGTFLDAPEDPTDPLGWIDGALVGSFEIAVRGPLGRGARRRVCVAEGLTLWTTPSFRMLNGRGLDPCDVTIDPVQSLSLSSVSAHLGSEDLSTNVTVGSSSGTMDLDVSPPSMAISLETPGHVARWEHSPLSLRTDTFGDSRILLRLPANAKGLVGLTVTSSGVKHQTVDSARLGDATTAIYPLDKAEDTVRALGTGHLVVQVPGREVLIASFRPATLARSARSSGSRVELEGLLTSEVEVIAWALYAPWLGPRTSSVTVGSWEIPAPLAGQGPIVFNLRVVDPWKSEPIPSTPVSRDLFLVDASVDGRADLLTQFLAGLETRGKNAFQADQVMAQLSFSSPVAAASHCRISSWQIDELRDAASPDEMLNALTELGVSRPRRPHLIVLSGCATETFSPVFPVREAELVEHMAFNPLEASLRDLDVLAEEDSPRRLGHLWQQAGDVLGTDVLEVLCGDDDPTRNQPTFDANAAAILSMPQGARDHIIAASKFLPRTVTDKDARAISALQLLTSLSDHRLADITTDSLAILSEVDTLLRRRGFKREADAIRARENPSAERRWMALPAVSLALAVSARLGAHGERDLHRFAKSRERQWSALSAVARKMCEIDLVLAEAYAVSATRAVHPVLQEPTANPETSRGTH